MNNGAGPKPIQPEVTTRDRAVPLIRPRTIPLRGLVTSKLHLTSFL